MSPTASTCGATCSSTPASSPPCSTARPADWTLKTDGGEEIRARYCVMAAGNLSTPRVPDFKGLRTFKGKWYHSGLWPHEGVDFSGLRVGVIGTGSSGVQMIPIIASQAKHLHVFQRTANFSLPARNGPMEPERERSHKAEYPARRAAAADTPFAIGGYPKPTRSALEVAEEERNAPTRPSGRKAAASATSMPTPTCW